MRRKGGNWCRDLRRRPLRAIRLGDTRPRRWRHERTHRPVPATCNRAPRSASAYPATGVSSRIPVAGTSISHWAAAPTGSATTAATPCSPRPPLPIRPIPMHTGYPSVRPYRRRDAANQPQRRAAHRRVRVVCYGSTREYDDKLTGLRTRHVARCDSTGQSRCGRPAGRPACAQRARRWIRPVHPLREHGNQPRCGRYQQPVRRLRPWRSAGMAPIRTAA